MVVWKLAGTPIRMREGSTRGREEWKSRWSSRQRESGFEESESLIVCDTWGVYRGGNGGVGGDKGRGGTEADATEVRHIGLLASGGGSGCHARMKVSPRTLIA